jgi:hypothetical protein
VRDPRNRCVRWKSVQERQQTLGAGAQRLPVEIGPYGRYVTRGARTTEHAYILSDFYARVRAPKALWSAFTLANVLLM